MSSYISTVLQSSSGILALCMAVLQVMIVAYLVWLTFKIKQLIVALTVLQQVIVVKSEKQIVFEFERNSLQPSKNSTQTEIHMIFLEMSTKHAPTALCVFMLAILASILWQKLYKNRNQLWFLNDNTTLCLEVISHQNSIIIPLKTLRGKPVDYTIDDYTHPYQLSVLGTLWLQLDINWHHNRKIFDKITGQTIFLPTMVTINWFQSYQLTKILHTTHISRLTWKQKSRFTPIDFPNSTTIPLHTLATPTISVPDHIHDANVTFIKSANNEEAVVQIHQTTPLSSPSEVSPTTTNAISSSVNAVATVNQPNDEDSSCPYGRNLYPVLSSHR